MEVQTGQMEAEQREQTPNEKHLEIPAPPDDEESWKLAYVFTQLTSEGRESRQLGFIRCREIFSNEQSLLTNVVARYTGLLALLMHLLMNDDDEEYYQLEAAVTLKCVVLGKTMDEILRELLEREHSTLEQMSLPHAQILSLLRSNNVEKLGLVCRGLALCSASIPRQVAKFINIPSVYLHFIGLLSHSSADVVRPVLYTLRDTLLACDDNIQRMIRLVLPPLRTLLTDKDERTRKAACSLLLNITEVGGVFQDMRDKSFIGPLAKVLSEDDDVLDVDKGVECAARIILSVLSSSEEEEIRDLVSEDCMHALCRFLSLRKDPDMQDRCFKVLYDVLVVGEEDRKKIGSRCNLYARMIAQAGFMNSIKEFVYRRGFTRLETLDMLKCYQSEDDETEESGDDETEEEEE